MGFLRWHNKRSALFSQQLQCEGENRQYPTGFESTRVSLFLRMTEFAFSSRS